MGTELLLLLLLLPLLLPVLLPAMSLLLPPPALPLSNRMASNS